MRRARPELAILLAAGCASAIPETEKARFATPQSAAEQASDLRPCIVVAETNARRLYEGTASLSFDPWEQVYATVVVRHPEGIVVFDPSFGRKIARDIGHSPLLFNLVTGSAATKVPAHTLLERAGIDPLDVAYAAITHAHWDHVGGLRDLLGARVFIAKAELAWAQKLPHRFDHGVLPDELDIDRRRWRPFAMDGGAYEGFERSHDLFGDGAIVAVALPGHTPGSTGYFINSKGNKRWFLIGDASWTVEGVNRPLRKNLLAQAMVDSDPEAAGRTLGLVHALALAHPEIPIVPAHDLAGMRSLPVCGGAP